MARHVSTYILIFFLALGRLSGGQEAERCDPRYCRLPNCFCGGSEIPGGYEPKDIPQFVLLTFDDAVNGLNQKFFEALFKNRVNPNGCPIKVKLKPGIKEPIPPTFAPPASVPPPPFLYGSTGSLEGRSGGL